MQQIPGFLVYSCAPAATRRIPGIPVRWIMLEPKSQFAAALLVNHCALRTNSSVTDAPVHGKHH